MNNNLLGQIYDMYRNEIYAYLYTLCKNREVAQDLLQETFLKAILSLPDNHTNVKAWLYMVARNLFYNHQNKEKWLADEKIDDNVINDKPGPEQVVVSELIKQDLYRALLQLDSVKREIIIMEYYLGMSQKEIATIIKTSPENIRVLTYRAKKELKKKMEGQGYDIS